MSFIELPPADKAGQLRISKSLWSFPGVILGGMPRNLALALAFGVVVVDQNIQADLRAGGRLRAER